MGQNRIFAYLWKILFSRVQFFPRSLVIFFYCIRFNFLLSSDSFVTKLNILGTILCPYILPCSVRFHVLRIDTLTRATITKVSFKSRSCWTKKCSCTHVRVASNASVRTNWNAICTTFVAASSSRGVLSSGQLSVNVVWVPLLVQVLELLGTKLNGT